MQCQYCGAYVQSDFCMKCGALVKVPAVGADNKAGAGKKNFSVPLLIGFAVLVLIVFIVAFNTKPPDPLFPDPPKSSGVPARQQPASRPLEYQLAVINAGGYVSENDVTVNRFRYLLETLQRETGYTRQQIADMNANAVKMLHDKYSKDMKLLAFMESTLAPLRVRSEADYKEIVTSLIILNGQ